MEQEILCVGEVLWDSLPIGLFLGGAPFNVGCHLHMMGQPVAIVSTVGDDVLGDEVLRRMEGRGMRTDLIRIDQERPTGFVKAELDSQGNATYDIVEPAAWDAIVFDDELAAQTAKAKAIVFGSLAQRKPTSRSTIRAICESSATKVFDVNLRPPYDDPQIVHESLKLADMVKLNQDELRLLATWFNLDSVSEQTTMRELVERYDLEAVCVTRGGRGAALLHEGRWAEHPGFVVPVQDTVGAGDAFLAALLLHLLNGSGDDVALLQANRVGGFVASRLGAVPDYDLHALGV